MIRRRTLSVLPEQVYSWHKTDTAVQSPRVRWRPQGPHRALAKLTGDFGSTTEVIRIVNQFAF
jgi:hypothetical protein